MNAMRVENWKGHALRFTDLDGEWYAVAKDVADVANAEGIDFLDVATMIHVGYLPLDDFLEDGEFIKDEMNFYSSRIALTTNERLLYITHWYGDSEFVKVPNIATNLSNILRQQEYRTALEEALACYELFYQDMPGVVKEAYKALGKQRGEIRPVNCIPKETPKPSEYAGVYLIRADNGLIKIGCTGNIKKRFCALKTSVPCGIKLIGFHKCQNYHEEEARLHTQFAGKREIGEWFKLDESELMALNGRFGLGLSVSEHIYRKYAGVKEAGNA